uniref:Reverse transcriptase zinc-binding domain-containing protein n=1 Tax=Trichuris muris TaxID=70415 RepID=A0A5S6Q124_TRIMR
MLRRVNEMLERVKGAAPKPQQKVQLIRTHLIPRLLCSFTNSNPTAGTAASADRMIRQAVKTLLLVPLSTISDSFFYLPMKEVGLGLQSLSEGVDFGMLNLYRRLSGRSDLAVRAAAELWFYQCRRSRLALKRDVVELTERGIAQPKAATLEHHRSLFAATYQGSGHREFAEACSNLWIDGDRMTGRSYIASIKARTSLVPTRLQTFRGRAETGDPRVLCLRCGHISGSPESLSHISQTCSFTHGLIVRRHDVVVKKLASAAEESGFAITVEPTLRHDGLTYKPDLIAVKGGKVWALDVAIPFESSDALARRHAEKCRKYQPLADLVRTITGAKEYGTGSIVIGARGAWCSRNDDTLRAMGWQISEKTKALLCVMTLERTNQLISWFMRSTDAVAFRGRMLHRGHESQVQPSTDRAQPSPRARRREISCGAAHST